MATTKDWDSLFIRPDGKDMRELPLVAHGITGQLCYNWADDNGEGLTIWPPRESETVKRVKTTGNGFILIKDSEQ